MPCLVTAASARAGHDAGSVRPGPNLTFTGIDRRLHPHREPMSRRAAARS